MFLLQIVHPDGTVVRFHAGERLEADLRDLIATETLRRLPAHDRERVQLALEAGIVQAFERFKAQAQPHLVE